MQVCDECHGSGIYVNERLNHYDQKVDRTSELCPYCRGEKRWEYECETCDGTGQVTFEEAERIARRKKEEKQREQEERTRRAEAERRKKEEQEQRRAGAAAEQQEYSRRFRGGLCVKCSQPLDSLTKLRKRHEHWKCDAGRRSKNLWGLRGEIGFALGLGCLGSGIGWGVSKIISIVALFILKVGGSSQLPGWLDMMLLAITWGPLAFCVIFALGLIYDSIA